MEEMKKYTTCTDIEAMTEEEAKDPKRKNDGQIIPKTTTGKDCRKHTPQPRPKAEPLPKVRSRKRPTERKNDHRRRRTHKAK